MLRDCTLQNFKSVYDKITLPLAPLTVFAGPNSSGKSTVIQSILLVAQTLQNPVPSRSVVLNGHILKLGEFGDLLSDGADSTEVSLGFTLGVSPEDPLAQFSRASIETIECDFSFSGRGQVSESRQLQPRLERTRLKVTTRSEEKPEVTELVVQRAVLTVVERLSDFRIEQPKLDAEAAALEYEISRPAYYSRAYRGPGDGRYVGASMNHFLPHRLTVAYDLVEEQSERLIQILTAVERYPEPERERGVPMSDQLRALIGKTVSDFVASMPLTGSPLPSRYLTDLSQLPKEFDLRQVLSLMRALPLQFRRLLISRFVEQEAELRSAVRAGRPAEYELSRVPLPGAADDGGDVVRTFFNRYVRYLGPLRDEPKPVYPLAGGADPRDIGYRGEHTAAVLDTHSYRLVEYYKPETSTPTRGALRTAVLDWLKYMGIADDVRTEDKGKLGHSLQIAAGHGDAVHDLTHVGVGVSQVLPILVLALLADPGSTLILEQPELHLHPRVQSRLADFFVSLTRMRKQCIVETHSEHLINRLRYLVAAAPDDSLSREALLYFVERESGRSRYLRIAVNSYGVIENWPRGFFDESEELAAQILRAGAEKRGHLRGRLGD